METLDLDDIQGILVRGYSNLKAACFLLLAIEDPPRAGAWLKKLVGRVTSGQDKPKDTALNIAFTAQGLKKLGLPGGILAQYSNEFLTGMATPHRQRILGDQGANAPEYWVWGGPANPAIDILLLLYARGPTRLAGMHNELSQTFQPHGLLELMNLDTGDLDGREPFGFRDGISQPFIEGLSKQGPPANTLRPGEFILGYRNEYGLYTDRPLVEPAADPQGFLPADPQGSGCQDLGRDGSYLVFRQMEQDVNGFSQFLDRVTQNPDGSSNPEARVKLAAKMVGRWPSGAPLVLSPEQDQPELEIDNDFAYHQLDPDGLRCPIGAHIRRTNPRDSLDPQPGTEKSIEVNKRHRLLRRGREYGEKLPPEALWRSQPSGMEGQQHGLHFICLVGNILRQFEFVQHTWLNNPKFNRLYDDVDPLVGSRLEGGGVYTVPGEPVRQRFTGLPQFVTVRGGGYFFLPGIGALRYLSSRFD